MSYTPGKHLIYSRLPAQDWFSPDEAAAAAGWSPSFIKSRIKDGTIPAQSYCDGPATQSRRHRSHRIHIDDLVLFILLNGNGRYQEKKSFLDLFEVFRNWPLWMLQELHKALTRHIQNRTQRQPTHPASSLKTEH